MVPADMLTLINNHGFADTDDTTKYEFLNDTIWDIESREAWPWLLQSVSLNFDGINPYPTNMPTNFKRVKWITDTNTGEAVWPERIETVRDRYGNSLQTVDTPTVFYFLGNQLRFYPIPTASVGRFLLDYRAWQQPLSSTSLETDVLMPPRHHMVIVKGTLQRLYNMDDDPELAQVQAGEVEQRLQVMREDTFNKQEMRADHIFTLEPDEVTDYPYWLP